MVADYQVIFKYGYAASEIVIEMNELKGVRAVRAMAAAEAYRAARAGEVNLSRARDLKEVARAAPEPKAKEEVPKPKEPE